MFNWVLNAPLNMYSPFTDEIEFEAASLIKKQTWK